MNRVVGHYEIVGKLGEGGMGVVYKARDSRLDRIVALKMLSGRHLDQLQRQRLVREARTASALNHPNIVTIYNIETVEGAELIAMEYVPGKSLAELVRPGGLPLVDVLRYASQIAEASHNAHAAGIIHRDLKSGNVMVTSDGLIKILDFGIAKYTSPAGLLDNSPTLAATLTSEGSVQGTVAYMSPEQASGGTVDARSDIFALGILLYELLCGFRPFEADSTLAILRKIQLEHPPPLRLRRPDLPTRVETIVEKALEKEAQKRYQTMLDFRADLQKCLEDISGERPLRVAGRELLRAGSDFSRLMWSHRVILLLIVAVLLGGFEFKRIEGWVSKIRISEAPPLVMDPDGVPANTLTASEWVRQAQSWLERYDKAGNIGRAIAASTRALELNSRNAMAEALLAEAYVRKNGLSPDPQWQRLAGEAGRKAVELGPELAAAHIANAIVLLAAARSEEAYSELQRALALDPLSATARMWLGEYYSRANDAKSAEESYRQAIRSDPENWVRYGYLGTFFYKNARYADAVNAYELARQRAPDSVMVLKNLAAAYHALDQYDQAVTTLQRALEIEPTDAVYTNLGTAQFFAGHYTDAATAFEKAVELNPGQYLNWGNLGDAHRWIPGHATQAKDAYNHAITAVREKLPSGASDPALLSSLAVYYAKNGDRQRALETIGRLEKSDRRPPATYFKALVVYEILGDRGRALNALESALRSGYSLHEIKNEPELTALRADRRYYNILAANTGSK
jgi:eukaryotic-like serine/threonine-protein kinase